LEKDTYKWVQGLRIIISSECFQTGVEVRTIRGYAQQINSTLKKNERLTNIRGSVSSRKMVEGLKGAFVLKVHLERGDQRE
jgi:hypothetical protein